MRPAAKFFKVVLTFAVLPGNVPTSVWALIYEVVPGLDADCLHLKLYSGDPASWHSCFPFGVGFADPHALIQTAR